MVLSYNGSIGLHFNLTEGQPISNQPLKTLTDSNGNFFGKQKFWEKRDSFCSREIRAERLFFSILLIR